MNSTKQLTSVFILLGVILGGFLLWSAWPLLTGTEIVLDTQPVDPFDPFRGQYMTIRYTVGSVPFEEGFSQGDTAYVHLREEAGIWVYDDISKVKPDGIFLKGNVERITGDTMRVTYGIEQFFFEHDADVPTRNITVKVKVSSGGTARIVELLQNGEPVKIVYEPISLNS